MEKERLLGKQIIERRRSNDETNRREESHSPTRESSCSSRRSRERSRETRRRKNKEVDGKIGLCGQQTSKRVAGQKHACTLAHNAVNAWAALLASKKKRKKRTRYSAKTAQSKDARWTRVIEFSAAKRLRQSRKETVTE